MVPENGTHTHTQTHTLIESIGPEGQCFENYITVVLKTKKKYGLVFPKENRVLFQQ